MYSNLGLVHPDIFVFGIDEETLIEFGPFQFWTRQRLADAITIFNSVPGETPAVIAVDIVYSGLSGDAEADAALVRAAEEGGNVVFGALASFDWKDDVKTFEKPFEALLRVSRYGAINAVIDMDGVVRRANLNLPVDGQTEPVFAGAVYEMYTGAELDIPPHIGTPAYLTYTGGVGDYYGAEGLGTSFRDIFDEDFDPSLYAGSIIIMGPYAAGLMDSYFTAANARKQMHGAEVHANIIQMLLEGNYKAYVPYWINLMTVILTLAVFGLVFLHADVRVSAAALILFTAGYVFMNRWLFEGGYILTLIYPPVSAAGLLAYTVIRNYIFERAEKKKIKDMFKKYIDPKLADALIKAGYEILSSSGTAAHLIANGIKVAEVSDITGVPSILGGRVKTLHPSVMGGILSRRGNDEDEKDRENYKIPLIDVVVCNLYPFEETAENDEASAEELIEKIDIGGVSLIRAAAKNYKDVAVITEIRDYGLIISELENHGGISQELREKLAVKAFGATAYYDAVVEKGLRRLLIKENEFPDVKAIPAKKRQNLRYGENPYQQAALYVPALSEGRAPFKQLWGKELSYNNIIDLNAVVCAADMFRGSKTAVIIKHDTPCGIASAETLSAAYEKALAYDTISAFGGVAGFTETIDMKTAELINKHFFEIVAAPGFEEEALVFLKTKMNLRILKLTDNYRIEEQITGCKAGLLMQEDMLPPLISKVNCRWIGEPKYELWEDVVFAWKSAWLTKSNAITIVKGGAAIGIGGGFTSRVDAARFALSRAGENARGAVMGSDAFFPFPDTVELAHAAGISVIVQPGGSIKDSEVEKRAEELGISMVISGTRTFRH